LRCFVAVLIAGFAMSGCGEEPYRYENFTKAEPSMNESVFAADHQICHKEKDKHINKIQGREFGFKGSETGYLGCMKLRGWDKKNPS
jgi:hypothetical protein